MENRIVKFKSKESAGLNLHAIPGHFATSHSHINYYVDIPPHIRVPWNPAPDSLRQWRR